MTRVWPEVLPSLRRFALRMTRHRDDAEDLVQRTCLRALERAHQLQPESSPRSWLFAIMYSLWISELRSRKSHGGDHAQWVEAHSAALYHDPESDLRCREVLALVDRLPEAQRTVLLLVALEGRGYKEVAQRLALPLGTVTSRLARARSAIEKMLDVQGAPGRCEGRSALACNAAG